MSKFINPTKVITGPNTRWSYANVWEPKSINGGTPKYSVSLIIPKSDTKTVEKIQAAIQAAYEEGQGKLKGNGKTVPALSVLKTPLRDGDAERPDDPAYADSYFMQAVSLLSTEVKCTVVFMAVPALTFMLSTPMVIRELPVVLTTFRRLRMESLLVASPVQRTILPRRKTRDSCLNPVLINEWRGGRVYLCRLCHSIGGML